jgi:RNA polymerase sigma-70 factor (ECF subfamily)
MTADDPTRARPADDDRIRAHADLVYGTCLRLTGNAQDAADVSQEVFVAWMRHQGRIRGPLAAWLHGTARRRSLDWLRRHHRRADHERRAAAEVPPAAAPEQASAAALRTALDAALAELDPRQRTLVIEHHLMGLSQAALAARWRISQMTVSRHLERARERLRKSLARHGVTGGAVPGAGDPLTALAALAAATPCPHALAAPLLAHARVLGAKSLVGAGTLMPWWATWTGLAAAGLAAALVLGLAGGLAWRETVAAGLPADPTGAMIAQLGMEASATAPAPGPALPHRYRSIEILIARLPPVDEARQARIRAFLTRDDAGPAWQWLTIDDDTFMVSRRKGLLAAPFHDVAANDARVIAATAPLFDDLRAGGSISRAGWLARDYREGRIRCCADLAREPTGAEFDTTIYLLWALGRRAHAGVGRAQALADIDTLAAAMQRYPTDVQETLFDGVGVDRQRDDIYLGLVLHGDLDDADIARWCAEPAREPDFLAVGVVNEGLLWTIPGIEDFARSGAPHPPWTYDPAQRPNPWEWFTLPRRQRDTAACVGQLARAQRAIRGQDTLGAIFPLPARVASYGDAPWVATVLEETALARAKHTAKRVLALLVTATRHGRPLPDSLAGISGLADDDGLIGGSAATYGLLYQKLSPTRFRLDLDRHGRTPTYADPVLLDYLSYFNQPGDDFTTKVAPDSDSARIAWETDTAALPASASAPAAAEPAPPRADN